MSKLYSDLYKETINSIKELCQRNIKRIDRLCESEIAKSNDIRELYVYREILDIINESEV